MEFIRDKVNRIFKIMENDQMIMETGFSGGEFVLKFYSEEVIFIPEELDQSFYLNICSLFANQYCFLDNYSSISFNTLIWLSDQYGDLLDENYVEKVSRLVITKGNAGIEIFSYNPYILKLGMNKPFNVVAFSSANNGRFTKNLVTGSSFQDDFINVWYNIINNQYEKSKVKRLEMYDGEKNKN